MSAFQPESFEEAKARQQARDARKRSTRPPIAPLKAQSARIKRSKPLRAVEPPSGYPASFPGQIASRKKARKGKKTKRAKLPSRKSLVRALDALVSQIVRLRDKHCVCCGTANQPTAGHIFSRRSLGGRWDLENVWQQCAGCNLRHCFNTIPFFRFYINLRGQEAFDAMYRKWEGGCKFSRLELIELKAELTAKLASMDGAEDLA